MAKKKKSVDAQASILKRLLAFMIDLAIINIVILFPFKVMFSDALPQTSSFDEMFNALQSTGASELIMVLSVVVAAISIAYFTIFERRSGQTPGKMLFSLYVVSQTKDLKQWQLIVRSLFLIPVLPFVLLWIVDPIVLLFTKDHNRLSEIISKTKVIEKVPLK